MSRRIISLVFCVLFLFSLTITASADSAASSIQIYASVNTDGDAEVTLTLRLRMEEAVDSLTFPLPLNATDITLNDRSVTATKSSNATWVTLTDIAGFLGEYSATFHYQIPGVVKMVEGKLTLDLPLLSGFEYPVESVNLTVMLPAAIETRPTFKSIYHQDSIETILEASVTNNLISGLITTTLKDRETLSMTMTVPAEMFSGVSTYVREGNPEIVPMSICAVLALLYWIIFLRTFPMLRIRRTTPPEGITAGEIGNRLTLGGADLTMMVFTWAQLGYVKIHLDDDGRVILYRRMDMGNERSAFEGKVFKLLFAKRPMVDGTGPQYARLARKVASSVPGKKILCKKGFGNPRIFRFLTCGVQIFCGVCFAMNMLTIPILQVIAAVALGILGGVSAWCIQGGMYRIHLRYKLPLIIALILSVLWIGLGIWAGQWILAALSVAAQLVCGIAAAYGGRRSDLGRQNASQILGLRQYYKTVTKEDLNRIQQNDPEYFFNNISFAMALGVDKSFAKRFGRRKMPPCPYFSCGVNSAMTAEDWNRFLHETAEILDSRQRRMEWEKYAIVRIR